MSGKQFRLAAMSCKLGTPGKYWHYKKKKDKEYIITVIKGQGTNQDITIQKPKSSQNPTN